jgi:hypothetical protein
MTALFKPTRERRGNELAILKQAAKAIKDQEKARQALKAQDERIKTLCHEYDVAAGVWGFQPHHLRNACEARGLL